MLILSVLASQLWLSRSRVGKRPEPNSTVFGAVMPVRVESQMTPQT